MPFFALRASHELETISIDLMFQLDDGGGARVFELAGASVRAKFRFTSFVNNGFNLASILEVSHSLHESWLPTMHSSAASLTIVVRLLMYNRTGAIQ